jgi:hypothetical protein
MIILWVLQSKKCIIVLSFLISKPAPPHILLWEFGGVILEQIFLFDILLRQGDARVAAVKCRTFSKVFLLGKLV